MRVTAGRMMSSHPEDNSAGLASPPETPTGSIAEHKRVALVMAHPGHELCVYGWVARLRPRVFILTDGSGRAQESRLEHTTTILDRLGAAKGSVYGRLSDASIYRALLTHDFNLFLQLAREIAETIVKEEFDCIVGDAYEGYNPAHDACRLIINAAVAMAAARRDANTTNLEFIVAGQPNARAANGAQHSCVQLDTRTLEAKLAVARNYPGLKYDVDKLLEKYSEQAFRTEYLYPAVDGHAHTWSDQRPPYYEQVGEQRVAEGYYAEAIRYREHLLPLARTLLCEVCLHKA